MQVKEKTKKVLDIFLKVLTWLIVGFTVVVVISTVIMVTTVDKNDRNLFGFKFFIVTSDSMSESENNADMDVHFNAGDIVIAQTVKDPKALQEGDIIAFISANPSSLNKTITHMIHDVVKDQNGNVIGYHTYGTNTGEIDGAIVNPEYVVGKYVGQISGLGNFFIYLKTTPGYVVCLLVPFLLLIIYNGVKIIRVLMGYKKEQTAQMQAEKAQIAAERKQNEDMLKELQALKQQLEMQNGGSLPPIEPQQSTPAETEETEPAETEETEPEETEETAPVETAETEPVETEEIEPVETEETEPVEPEETTPVETEEIEPVEPEETTPVETEEIEPAETEETEPVETEETEPVETEETEPVKTEETEPIETGRKFGGT